MNTRSLRHLSFLFLVLTAPLLQAGDEAPAPDAPAPPISVDPTMPVGELQLLLKPLTREQLLIEAEAWQAELQRIAREIAHAEIAVKRQNTEIKKVEETQKDAEETKRKLETAKQKIREAKETGDTGKVQEAQQAAEEAKEKLKEVSKSVEEASEAARKTEEMKKQVSEETRKDLERAETSADQATRAVEKVEETVKKAADESEKAEQGKGDGRKIEETNEAAKKAAREAEAATEQVTQNVEETLKKIETATESTEVMKEAGQVKARQKVNLLEKVADLREKQTGVIDRFNVVLNALEKKTSKDDTDTLAEIQDYRQYIATVGGFAVDLEDTTSTWIAIKGWLFSPEGGLRLGRNLLSFVVILLVTWLVAGIASGIVRKILGRYSRFSRLLANFLVGLVKWLVVILGLIWALSALEISVGPVLAIIGAASFVIAFALQDSLGNFASGLMILGFRPFDEGDVVEAGGVSGTVTAMNLVSTTVKTFDNQIMIVPNKMIWNAVITNVTGAPTRRVDLTFGIGYHDDAEKAMKIMADVLAAHPLVLKEPAPTIKLHSLGDSSVNFICRPWVKTGDYWTVYWDVMQEVKKRFDQNGVSIPFPQRDVHLFVEKGEIGKE